jgi:hypothetical protein
MDALYLPLVKTNGYKMTHAEGIFIRARPIGSADILAVGFNSRTSGWRILVGFNPRTRNGIKRANPVEMIHIIPVGFNPRKRKKWQTHTIKSIFKPYLR